MEVLVFRHGPAGDKDAWLRKGLDDAARPLTPDGRRKTARAAAGLRFLVEPFDVIATSSLLRARQTADALAARFRRAKKVVLEELKPDVPSAKAAERLLSLKARRVAVVGHEPQLSGVIAELLGCSSLKLELKKAGACLLALDRPKPGAAKLLWLLPPRALRGLRTRGLR